MIRTIATIVDWDALASEFLLTLQPGTLVTLSGPLGAGKTTFVQALARALGVRRHVTSPTFSLVRTYQTHHSVIRRLVHVDAYRIERPEDMTTLGLEDFLAQPGTLICLEWPENAQAWLARQDHVISLTIRINPDGARQVSS